MQISGLLAPAGVCQELHSTRATPKSRCSEDQPADSNLGFLSLHIRRPTGCGYRCWPTDVQHREGSSACMKCWAKAGSTITISISQLPGGRVPPNIPVGFPCLSLGGSHQETVQHLDLLHKKGVCYRAELFTARDLYYVSSTHLCSAQGGKKTIFLSWHKVEVLEISPLRFAAVVWDICIPWASKISTIKTWRPYMGFPTLFCWARTFKSKQTHSSILSSC